MSIGRMDHYYMIMFRSGATISRSKKGNVVEDARFTILRVVTLSRNPRVRLFEIKLSGYEDEIVFLPSLPDLNKRFLVAVDSKAGQN